MASQSEMVEIKVEHRTPIGVAAIARYEFSAPCDQLIFNRDIYRFDMCVTPRPKNARARYVSRWQPNRQQKLGAIYLLPPDETIHFQSEAGATTCVVCELRPESLANWLGKEVSWDDAALNATLNVPSPRIRAKLLNLGDELRHPGFATAAMIELMLAQLGLELCRSWPQPAAKEISQGLPEWRLRLIEERLADGKSIPSLSELATLCNISVRQLTRGFKLSRGCSIGAFIADDRIEAAKRRLQSKGSIKAIARELGFRSPSSFAYSFRKATGSTPRDYKAGF